MFQYITDLFSGLYQMGLLVWQLEYFDLPLGKYAAVLGGLLLLWWLLRLVAHVLRLGLLYLLVLFTGKGRIAYVRANVDGDTIKVNDRKDKSKSVAIRMIGVDTPESLPSLYMDVQPFGKDAAEYTRKRLRPGQRVLLLYDREPLDKFGRELVYVYTAWGEFYNATLVRKGYAFAVEYKPNLRHARYLKRMEAKARNSGKRLWEVYQEKGQLGKDYKKSKEYRRFKYKHERLK